MDEVLNSGGAVDAIVKHTRTPVRFDTNGVPQVLLPEGWKLEDLERTLSAPVRAKGAATMQNRASFVEYVNSLKDEGSRVYCAVDWTNGKLSIKAVINDTRRTIPGWCDLTATYAPTFSEDWTRWTTFNKKEMGQVDFALFLEDNIDAVTAKEGYPSGSDILKMALTFEANQEDRFKSAVRLESGGYDLTVVSHEDDATEKKMRLFNRFAIAIPCYRFGDSFIIEARLRHRKAGTGVVFSYELVRLDRTIAVAVQGELDALKEALSLPVLLGGK